MTELSKPTIWSYQTDDDAKVTPRVTPARYPNQHDSSFVLENSAVLEEKQLSEMFKGIGQKFENNENYMLNGTTASIVNISREGILTAANIGDSPINIFVIDSATKKITSTETISTLHTPKSEMMRIFNAGGNPVGGVLWNYVTEEEKEDKKREDKLSKTEVSRAFGDRDMKGMIYEPAIVSVDLNNYFKSGQEVFVTVESDGAVQLLGDPKIKDKNEQEADLSKRTALLNKKRAQLIENGNSENLAKALVNAADECGSTDNITSVVIHLKEKPSQNITAGVFDGHGRNYEFAAKASNLAKEQFSQEILALQAHNNLANSYAEHEEQVFEIDPELNAQFKAITQKVSRLAADEQTNFWKTEYSRTEMNRFKELQGFINLGLINPQTELQKISTETYIQEAKALLEKKEDGLDALWEVSKRNPESSNYSSEVENKSALKSKNAPVSINEELRDKYIELSDKFSRLTHNERSLILKKLEDKNKFKEVDGAVRLSFSSKNKLDSGSINKYIEQGIGLLGSREAAMDKAWQTSRNNPDSKNYSPKPTAVASVDWAAQNSGLLEKYKELKNQLSSLSEDDQKKFWNRNGNAGINPQRGSLKDLDGLIILSARSMELESTYKTLTRAIQLFEGQQSYINELLKNSKKNAPENNIESCADLLRIIKELRPDFDKSSEFEQYRDELSKFEENSNQYLNKLKEIESYLQDQKQISEKDFIRSKERAEVTGAKKLSIYELYIKPIFKAGANNIKSGASSFSQAARPHLKAAAAALGILTVVGASIWALVNSSQTQKEQETPQGTQIVQNNPVPRPGPTPELVAKASPAGTTSPEEKVETPAPSDVQMTEQKTTASQDVKLFKIFDRKTQIVDKDMRAEFEQLLRQGGNGEYRITVNFGHDTSWERSNERRQAAKKVFKALARDMGLKVTIAPSTKKNRGVSYTEARDERQRGISIEKLPGVATKPVSAPVLSNTEKAPSKKATSATEKKKVKANKVQKRQSKSALQPVPFKRIWDRNVSQAESFTVGTAKIRNGTLFLSWNAKDNKSTDLPADLQRALNSFLENHKRQCSQNVTVFKPAYSGDRTSLLRHASTVDKVRDKFGKTIITGDATVVKLSSDVAVACPASNVQSTNDNKKYEINAVQHANKFRLRGVKEYTSILKLMDPQASTTFVSRLKAVFSRAVSQDNDKLAPQRTSTEQWLYDNSVLKLVVS